jgi:hypothetical protein
MEKATSSPISSLYLRPHDDRLNIWQTVQPRSLIFECALYPGDIQNAEVSRSSASKTLLIWSFSLYTFHDGIP